MAGVLNAKAWRTPRLGRFGYVTLFAKKDAAYLPAGEGIRGHEFHRWDCDVPGGDFTAEKASGRRWDCVVATDRLYAGFPHFHFYANPDFAVRFYETCLKEKHRDDREPQADGDRKAQL